MSSLANTTEKLRSVLKISAIVLGAAFLLYLFVSGGVIIKNIFFPPPPDTPLQEFGELPEMVFKEKASAAIDYQLNTVSGELPTNLPNKMFVYKIEKPRPDLLALQNSRKIANAADFKQGETKVSDSIYQWANPAVNSLLQYNLNTKDFQIKSNLVTVESLLNSASIPDEDRIKQYVGELLNKFDVDRNDLYYNENSFKYYSLSGGNLTQVDNIFNAKVIRVSLFNKNIENELGEFGFVYPDPNTPLVSLVVAFPSSGRMITIEAKVFNKVITEESSDYPIKSPAEAFDELKQGKGYLYNPNDSGSVQITDVYLAYYLDESTEEYAQPVYVFEGTTARAYVPAVKSSSQSEATSE